MPGTRCVCAARDYLVCGVRFDESLRAARTCLAAAPGERLAGDRQGSVHARVTLHRRVWQLQMCRSIYIACAC